MNVLMLVLLSLAAARATHLVTDDLLPFGPVRDRLARAKHWIPQYAAHGLKCTFCVSVWAGAASAWLATAQGWATPPEGGFWGFAVLAFAFAQAIVLIELVVFKLLDES